MTRADFYGGLVLAAFFGAALWEATTFQYGTEFSPGPGFAPVWLSAVGLIVSLLIAGFGFWNRRADAPAEAAPPVVEKRGVARVAVALVALAAMILLVPALGLMISLLVFLLFLTLGVQRLSPLTGIGASVGTVVFVYVVFVHFLDVPIPKGPLGL